MKTDQFTADDARMHSRKWQDRLPRTELERVNASIRDSCDSGWYHATVRLVISTTTQKQLEDRGFTVFIDPDGAGIKGGSGRPSTTVSWNPKSDFTWEPPTSPDKI